LQKPLIEDWEHTPAWSAVNCARTIITDVCCRTRTLKDTLLRRQWRRRTRIYGRERPFLPHTTPSSQSAGHVETAGERRVIKGHPHIEPAHVQGRKTCLARGKSKGSRVVSLGCTPIFCCRSRRAPRGRHVTAQVRVRRVMTHAPHLSRQGIAWDERRRTANGGQPGKDVGRT
jgi:hypothetical protein